MSDTNEKTHFEEKKQTLKITQHDLTTVQEDDEKLHHTRYHQSLKKTELIDNSSSKHLIFLKSRKNL